MTTIRVCDTSLFSSHSLCKTCVHTHTHTHTPLTTIPGTTPQSPTSPQSHQQASSRPRPVARKRTPTDSDLESSTSSSSPLTSINSTHALSQRQASTCDSIAEELDIYTDDNGAEADTFAQPAREEEEKLKMELDRMKREKESLQVYRLLPRHCPASIGFSADYHTIMV